jgi:flavin-dependent dehydrogenase
VWRDLQIQPQDYPYRVTKFRVFEVWLKNIHFHLRTQQFAIRRVEFDHWMIQRVAHHLVQHKVEEIEKVGGEYVIDGEYAAPYLVGAGGTHCPVRRKFFSDQKDQGTLIIAQEEEFPFPYVNDRCHLWFLQNRLPGYAWYFPKAGGVLNVGVGGSASGLKANRDTLNRHWDLLVEKLEKTGLVRGHTFKPSGHSFYLRGKAPVTRVGNALLVGDSLGLSTLDMGEGISPSILSGIKAARSIIENKPYSVTDLPRFSIPSLLGLR